MKMAAKRMTAKKTVDQNALSFQAKMVVVVVIAILAILWIAKVL